MDEGGDRQGGGRGADRRRDNLNQVRAWALALEMSYSVIGGGAIGYVLDRFVFGTLPWITLGLSLGGLAFGMVRFVREANRLNRESSRRRP
ncbi:MAG: AtpZ/AtpI family protein [Phycisphaerales bacterium]